MAEPAGSTAPADVPDPTSSGRSDDVKVGEERKDSCVKAFDALWFCYSPAFQLREYYMYGTVDNCFGKWGDLVNCLKKKTARYKEEVLAEEAKQQHPLWDVRTHAEAAQFWRQEFGHLGRQDGGGASGEEADGGAAGEGHHHSGKPTLV